MIDNISCNSNQLHAPIPANTTMKKPTKPPPPPPPPPRRQSPARSCYSNFGGCASECGSVPLSTRSLQPQFRSHSPAGPQYQSCGSESVYTSNYTSCCPSCCPSSTPAPSCYESQSSYASFPSHCKGCAPIPTCRVRPQSPCASTHSHHSHHNVPLNQVPVCKTFSHVSRCNSHKTMPLPPPPPPSCHQEHCHESYPVALQERKAIVNNFNNINNNNNLPHMTPELDAVDGPPLPRKEPPPKPKERTFRPRLSISPMPTIKNNSEVRLNETCKSSSYRRHIEQHLVSLFKYLREREESRQKEIYHIRKRLNCTDIKIEQTLLGHLAIKESHHLRSLRRRLRPDDFIVHKKLGAGAIGNVFLVEKKSGDTKDSPRLCAMKKLEKSQVFRQDHMAHVMAERDILAEADNEWIVKLYYSFQDDRHLYFILEYIPGGDMMNLLYQQNVFPEEWASFYIAEISLALQFVHDMKFIHRDIKPDNILIDAKGHIKLTDFGLCTGFRWTHDSKYYRDDTLNSNTQFNDHIPTYNKGVINNSDQDHPTITKALTKREMEYSLKKRSLSLVGSPNYIAPEVLRQASCYEASTNEELCDWWSVGVILYEMVIGYCPFIDLQKLKQGIYDPQNDLAYNIQERILNWKEHLAFPDPNDPNAPPLMQDASGNQHHIRDHTKDLIRSLLCDPQDRLCQNGIRDLQNHPFFHGIDWRNIRSRRDPPYIPELSHELDTRHFDTLFSQSSEPDNLNTLSGNSTKMPMNDFTYKRKPD